MSIDIQDWLEEHGKVTRRPIELHEDNAGALFLRIADRAFVGDLSGFIGNETFVLTAQSIYRTPENWAGLEVYDEDDEVAGIIALTNEIARYDIDRHELTICLGEHIGLAGQQYLREAIA